MTIIKKLNEIEARTMEIAHEARELDENKRNYEGLLECEIHDHEWRLEGVVSNLRDVETIHLECVRCRCYAFFGTLFANRAIPVQHHTDVLLTDLLGPEEDE